MSGDLIQINRLGKTSKNNVSEQNQDVLKNLQYLHMRLIGIKAAVPNLTILSCKELRKHSAKNIAFAIFKTLG